LRFLLDEKNFKKPHDEFAVAALDRHPGIAVVDLDRDGFDDFYVMVPEGKNMFFRNRGDGTFEEIAAKLGLDFDGFTSSAIFADFNNDGYIDVFIGRTLKPSIYLVNENGRFVDRSKDLVSGPLPHLVSSVTAMDYNNDGLLDLYVATYAARMTFMHQASIPQVFSKYLPEADVKELGRLLKSKDTDWVRNFPGPPNVLLKNLGGGKFEV